MSLIRFFSIILVFGFWQISGFVWAGSGDVNSKSNQVVVPHLTAPDTPDMPSDDPSEPDGLALMFTAPDTPDMPSDDPSEPDGLILMFTAPDTPDMPTDDPSEPDGRSFKNRVQPFGQAPSASSIWDKAMGWVSSLLDFS